MLPQHRQGAAGGRLLLSRLSRPLCRPDAIHARLDAVAWLIERRDLRMALRQQMRSLADQARALSRLSLNRGGPRDLVVIRDALAVGETLAARLNDACHRADPDLIASCPAEIEAVIAALIPSPSLSALRERLARAVVDEPPLSLRDGGYIREGFHADLDEARSLRDDSRQIILALEQRLAAEFKA